MSRRAPISIGINPQIAAYSVILGAVCAYSKCHSRSYEVASLALVLAWTC